MDIFELLSTVNFTQGDEEDSSLDGLLFDIDSHLNEVIEISPNQRYHKVTPS